MDLSEEKDLKYSCISVCLLFEGKMYSFGDLLSRFLDKSCFYKEGRKGLYFLRVPDKTCLC